MSPFDSSLQNWFFLTQEVFIFKGSKSKLNLNFYQMDICFEFLNIHMSEKGTTCDDYYGFKW
jgi:hypothetical protein